MSSKYLTALQQGLSPEQRLEQIVQHGMCIGCGLCESIATSAKVQMQVLLSGFDYPVAKAALDHAAMDKITAVCPGTRVEGLPAALVDDGTQQDDVWGAWRSMYYVHSAEPDVRHQAATGGQLTALALYLLEEKRVDFILHAKAHSEHPSFGEATISRNRADVLQASGSRYGPTATLKNALEVLQMAEQAGERFAFIGTPCDVSALRNLARQDPRVDELCQYMLTMVCGGFMAPAGLKTFVGSMGIIFSDITNLRYRGYGCPGPTTITTKDGSEHSISYLDFWGEDDSKWQLPTRCKVCPDGIGDAADIAAADTWDGGAPTQHEIDTDLGRNAAVVRTARGEQLMEQAIDAGYLVRGAALTPADMNRFQPHQEAKKRAAWARFEGRKAAKAVVPDTKGLRIKRLWQQNSSEQNAAQTEGAKLRAQRAIELDTKLK